MQDKVRAPAGPDKDGDAGATLVSSRARVQRILELAAAMPDTGEDPQGAETAARETDAGMHPLYRQAMFD
ncbi:MAG: hypothetical protein KDJ87_11035 [Rhizobiaceae bacterium]|nr:hypothetical protein [Rhizobiaceae bacterium]